MLETARRIAAPFLHCRVDFMYNTSHCYLGEITLSPSGFYVPLRTPALEEVRGALYDISRQDALAERGREIASKLGWPTDTSFGHFANDPRLATAGQ